MQANGDDVMMTYYAIDVKPMKGPGTFAGRTNGNGDWTKPGSVSRRKQYVNFIRNSVASDPSSEHAKPSNGASSLL